MAKVVIWNIYIAIRIVQGILSMAGNGVTIAAVMRSPNLRSTPHLLIANLALGDFFHGVGTSVMFPLKSFLTSFPAWKISCLVVQSFESVTVLHQFICITMVSVERLVALRSKLGISRFRWSPTFTMALIVVTWSVVIIVAVSLLVAIQNIRPGVPCRMVLVFGEAYVTVCMSLLLLATVSMLVMNGKIAKIAWDSHKRQCHMVAQRKDIGIARMLAIVVGVFFLLYSPVLCMSFAVNLTSPTWLRFIYYILILWSDISFWINPLIYMWRNKDFRTGIKTIFGRHFRVSEIPSGNKSTVAVIAMPTAPQSGPSTA